MICGWDLHITVSGLAVENSSSLKCSEMLIVWLHAITEVSAGVQKCYTEKIIIVWGMKYLREEMENYKRVFMVKSSTYYIYEQTG